MFTNNKGDKFYHVFVICCDTGQLIPLTGMDILCCVNVKRNHYGTQKVNKHNHVDLFTFDYIQRRLKINCNCTNAVYIHMITYIINNTIGIMYEIKT